MSAHLRHLTSSESATSTGLGNAAWQAPLQVFTGHKDEGFAIDWSSVSPGRLLTGVYTSHCTRLFGETV